MDFVSNDLSFRDDFSFTSDGCAEIIQGIKLGNVFLGLSQDSFLIQGHSERKEKQEQGMVMTELKCRSQFASVI